MLLLVHLPADHIMGDQYLNQPGHGESQTQVVSIIRMSSSLMLVTLALLSVNVSCLPGPDPGTYHFSKTVWTKEAPSHDLKIGKIQILKGGVLFFHFHWI